MFVRAIKISHDELIERFDSRCGDPVVSGDERVQRRIDRTLDVNRHVFLL
jgi:hypothetical protein